MWINYYSKKYEIFFIGGNVLSFCFSNVSFVLLYCNERNVQNGFRGKKRLQKKKVFEINKKIEDSMFWVFWIFGSILCWAAIP